MAKVQHQVKKQTRLEPSLPKENGTTGTALGFQMDSDPYVRFYKDIEWIENRCKELRISIDYEKMKEEKIVKTADDIMDSVKSEVEGQVEDASISYTTVFGSQLADILFKATIGYLENSEDIDAELEEMVVDEVQENIEKLLKEEDQICSLIAAENKEVSELEHEVLNLQLGLAKMTNERYNLVQKIQKRQEKMKQLRETKSKTERIKKLHSMSSKLSHIICINNHIMQLLICYSGVNWAKDQKMLETLCECGKPLDVQIQNVD